VVSNSYSGFNCGGTKTSGVRIFGDAYGDWVRTRPVWNQHAYHVTNVSEAGEIPAIEQFNWLTPGLNNYRQNRQPGSEFAAPDAVVSLGSSCDGTFSLVAAVRNLGSASLPSGVVVGFYAGVPGSGTKLGEGVTTKVLYPAEAELVTFAPVPPDVEAGTTPVYAVVDDTLAPHTWAECRTDNNVGTLASAACGSVN